MYGLHKVRALRSRHAGRVASVTIASQHGDPRLAEIQAPAAEAGKLLSRALPLTVLMFSAMLAACGDGGGSAPASASISAPTSVSTPPVTHAPPSTASADTALADRLYAGTERTPDGFAVEARPANVAGTLATRHLKNTDLATDPPAISPTYEVCTNDMAQAVAWSESQATRNAAYADLSEVHGGSRLWEVTRVPRADPTALLRHRVFRCDYLDRANTDLRADAGPAGNMNQRPLTARELRALAEYLWQFTSFNNADTAVQSSSGSVSGSSIVHAIRMGQLVRGAGGGCDTVQILDWTHTMDSTTGALTRSLTNVRTFKVKNSGGVTELCAS